MLASVRNGNFLFCRQEPVYAIPLKFWIRFRLLFYPGNSKLFTKLKNVILSLSKHLYRFVE